VYCGGAPTTETPTLSSATTAAPTSVGSRPPTPPVVAVPPTTTAVITGSSKASARPGLPALKSATSNTAVMPAHAPEYAKIPVTTRRVGTPANAATRSAVPMARTH
jgi:hypothetical protein